jgi:hypothetical protein
MLEVLCTSGDFSCRSCSQACTTRLTTISGPGRITREEIRYSQANRTTASASRGLMMQEYRTLRVAEAETVC